MEYVKPFNELAAHLEESAEHVRAWLGERMPRIGIILGSGLGFLGDELEDSAALPYAEVPYMKTSTAAGHVGRFVCGTLAGKEVLVCQGRLHGYEGYAPQDIAYPVWLMHELGIEVLITTNAAGAINEEFHVGDFCLMADHINFTGRNPIANQEANGLAPRFFSMYEAYDLALREIALDVADREFVPLHEGVYLGLLGPSFETPAEIRMFRAWGADTVAMSVVEEVIAARHVGMRVLGISLCTNMACGIEDANPTDEEVRDVAAANSDNFRALITGVLTSL